MKTTTTTTFEYDDEGRIVTQTVTADLQPAEAKTLADKYFPFD